MRDSGGESTQQIKDQKAYRSHAVFDVVAEDPQRPHVADNVYPATVQEEARKKRPVVVYGKTDLKRPIRPAVAGRNHAEQIEELVERLLGHGQLAQKHQAVGENEQPCRDGRVYSWNRILYRKHVLTPRPGAAFSSRLCVADPSLASRQTRRRGPYYFAS